VPNKIADWLKNQPIIVRFTAGELLTMVVVVLPNLFQWIGARRNSARPTRSC